MTMRSEKISIILVWLLAIVLSGEASKCPEVRKPHVTSCTIFYNCINLPEGGYVWAPAKCQEGLVFQPYLRMCVLPGDSWHCDDPLSEKLGIIGSYEEPQLLDTSQTSYLAQSQQEHSQLANVRPPTTPYPLIEIDKEKDGIPPSESLENNLHQFFQSQHKLETRLDAVLATKHGASSNRYTWLRGIIDRILLFENYEGLVSRLDASCRSRPVLDHLKKTENLQDLDVLAYLVESYILGTRNPVVPKLKNKKSTTREGDKKGEKVVNEGSKTTIDEANSERSIVVIDGNLGQREYVTVERYKDLSSSHVQVRVIEILPCARGVRLPNLTDCTKYYTCIPESATVVEFSCPPRTAFNDFNRVCDPRRFNVCARKREKPRETSTSETTPFDVEETVEKRKPCLTIGKFIDPTSEGRYYVCYASQTDPTKIESLRMSCPNDLIFCQERRICTVPSRCYDR